MTSLHDNVLDHLSALVSYDTQNPPRNIGTDGLFAYLTEQLAGFDCTLNDYGDGSVSLLAIRGQPDTVFNFHVDTVPIGDDWSQDPFSLTIKAGRATGLGACDIKGASAAMLAASAATDGDLALLFTSDEESGAGICVPAFLDTHHGFDHVVVAEPTRCQAVLAHRGIATASIQFKGVAGHASDARYIRESAVHRAIRWAHRCLEYAADHGSDSFDDLVGLPLNIGRIEGGVKPNVVASSATMRVGVRPLPLIDGKQILETLKSFANPEIVREFNTDFVGPSLPVSQHRTDLANEFARRLGLSIGPAVEFWTEAALFSQSGMTAIVYGPGDISQAHAANEWVDVAQLERAANIYVSMIEQCENAYA